MNDIKAFLTLEINIKDLQTCNLEGRDYLELKEGLNFVLSEMYNLIKEGELVQIKITNLPPRRSGFIRASELENIEKGGD